MLVNLSNSNTDLVSPYKRINELTVRPSVKKEFAHSSLLEREFKQDFLDLSDEAKSLLDKEESSISGKDNQGVESGKAEGENKHSAGPDELTEEEEKEVGELEKRDREVRNHEQAHVAAAGAFVNGGISYDYQIGPDDKRYAVGGEVSIDTSPIANDPEATIQKAQVVQQAALAPADPSGQDYRVAAAASQMMIEAQQELSKQRSEETQEVSDEEGQANDDFQSSQSLFLVYQNDSNQEDVGHYVDSNS